MRAPPGEQPEAVLEPVRHRGQRQCPQTGGRELDRQGLAVHSATDVLDDPAGVIVVGKSGSYRAGAIDEQLDGGRRRQTEDLYEDFAGNAQRLAACRDQPKRGHRPDQGVGQGGRLSDDVFAVVDDDDQ